MYLALCRVTLHAEGDESSWRAPAGARSFIDLRGPAGQGAEGFGLCAFDADPSGQPNIVMVLSDDPEGLLSARSVMGLQDNLGVDLIGIRAADAVRTILTRDADPTGLTKWKPLMPSRRLMYPIHLKAYSSNQVFDPADPDMMGPVLGVVREDLSRNRKQAARLIADTQRWERAKAVHLARTGKELTAAEALAANEAHSAKVLDAYMHKYPGHMPEEFIKAGDARLDPLPHDTVVTDNFSGTWSDDWTHLANSGYSNSSGQCVLDTSGTVSVCARHNTDLSSDDMYGTMLGVSQTGGSNTCSLGVALRLVDSAGGIYSYRHDDTPFHGQIRKWPSVDNLAGGGAGTTLADDGVNHGAITNDVLYFEVDGSSLLANLNGGDEISTTDTDHTGNTGFGLFGRTDSTATTVQDDYEAGDLGAGHHELTGDNVVTQAPTLEQGSLTQVHSLAGNNVEAGAPTLEEGNLTQVHDLTGDDVETGAPTLDEGTLSIRHNLTGDDVEADNPTLTEGTLTQVHDLTGTDVVTPPPTVAEGSLTQIHDLTGTGIATQAPTLEEGVLTQHHELDGDDIEAGAPTLTEPTLTITHPLTGNDVVTGPPELTDGILTQHHDLTGDGITTGAPTLGTPILTPDIDAPVTDSNDPQGPIVRVGKLMNR